MSCPASFRITTANESNVYKMQQQQRQQQQQQQNNLKIKRSFKRRRFIMAHLLYLSVAIIAVTMTQNMLQAEAVPALVSGGVGIGYWTLYDAGTQHQQQQQHQLQQQQLWHQRYKRDMGLAMQQPQSQKENLKDSLQQSSSTEVSLEQPQGQCLLDGEYVPETTVFCEKQVGCRAIQKTGHCCPDYKCDCQKDGKTYLNGDKLVDPETPCTVCYCQGGEILCSSVTCFHRDDCTPKYIPGVCCPEYDNCPVATSESSLNKTLTTTSTTVKPEIHQAENNPKITIKEITKPIEIRITDDNKAIPIHQMLKPSTTSTTTTTTTTTTTSTMPPPSAPSQSTATNSESTNNSPQTLNTTTKTFATTGTQTLQFVEAIKQNPSSLSTDNNQSTNESLEKLSTDNAHTNKNGLNGHKGGINGGDTLKLSASVAYPTTIVNMGGSTETSAEVEDPVPALSVFSTQGLPEDPSKVNIKREYFITTEGVAVVPPAAVFSGYGSGDYPNTELIYSQTAGQGQASYNAGLQPQTSGELDPDTAGSDNIYHIILTTDGPRLSSTTENYLALKGVSTTEGTFFEDLTLSSLSPVEIHNKLDVNSQPTTEADSKSTTESALQQQHLDDDDSAIPVESNPAYPSLPEDDFSLRDNNFQINDSDDIGDEPRSIGGGHHGIVSSFETFKATKHLEDTSYGSGGGSGSGSGSVLIADELPLGQSSASSSSTEGSGDFQSSTESYEKLKPAEVVQFMYSGEDSSEETRITNSTDFKLMMDDASAAVKGMKIMDTSLESSETQQQQQMEFEMGSGSGEIKSAKQQQQPKEREPTTARPNKHTTALDIDEVHDASGNGPQDDPKLDVESLKVEDNANDSSLNTEKSSKNNVLSVNVQPSQEKQLHDELH